MDAIIKNNINRIALVIGIVGIVGIVSAFFIQDITWAKYLARFLNPVNLRFGLGHSSIFYYTAASELNLLFYTALIYGVYTVVKKRDDRLLKFCFAVIFLQSAVGFLAAILGFILPYGLGGSSNYLALFLRLISSAVYSYVGYSVVKHLVKSDEASYSEREFKGKVIRKYAVAEKGTRFFHHIFDLLIAVFSLSYLLSPFISRFIETIAQFLGPGIFFAMFLAIIKLVYYVTFEFAFSSTPAKMLSDTKVIDESGKNISLETATVRTLTRWIPFEPFSFLGSKGWHDSATKTKVCKIKETPERSTIWWLIPIFIALYIVLRVI